MADPLENDDPLLNSPIPHIKAKALMRKAVNRRALHSDHVQECIDTWMAALAESGLAIVPVEPTEARWCQPSDGHGLPGPRKFIVLFEDADAGISVFESEREAREFYDAAVLNYNCTLFGAMPEIRAAQEPTDGRP